MDVLLPPKRFLLTIFALFFGGFCGYCCKIRLGSSKTWEWVDLSRLESTWGSQVESSRFYSPQLPVLLTSVDFVSSRLENDLMLYCYFLQYSIVQYAIFVIVNYSFNNLYTRLQVASLWRNVNACESDLITVRNGSAQQPYTTVVRAMNVRTLWMGKTIFRGPSSFRTIYKN